MPGVVEKTSKKVSKNAYRRSKKKEKAKREGTQSGVGDSVSEVESLASDSETDDNASVARSRDLLSADDIATEYDLDHSEFESYKEVFLKFQQPTEEEAAKEEEKPEIFYEDDEIPDEEEEAGVKKLSKKARKAANRLSVAQLKAIVPKPELVEWTDVDSSDPRLLVLMKTAKNVVPVPGHWSLKREYLSSKRGIEKSPFSLPKFIQETGISEMRDAHLEKQEGMTLKQKQRERVQGKVGKLDIDYSKLYDAFFRRQTKPEMTRYGEVYYEGKEYETNMKHLRPGELSDELKEALGMTAGGPPPWLVNQQRWGPPPSYPSLKIPGVNVAIPQGANYGYQPGQWGKTPVGPDGAPLLEDFLPGEAKQQVQSTQFGEPVEKGIWGALRLEGESDEEEEDDEDEEEEGDEEGGEDVSGIQTSMTAASTMPSEMGGTESIGGEFTLRKQRRGIDTEEPHAPRSAYQVLPEKNIQSTGFFGGEHAYDLDAARRDQFGHDNRRKRKAEDVEVSVDVDAFGDSDRLNQDALRKQYEAQKKAETHGQWQSIDQDDLSDMIAQESRKRMKREEEKRNRR
ncbi:DUF382-domain-containing protein [Lophiostoma macrostomum CBS 122681]|uniref:DUF382-domain-containing protein n=1 Tax=Lophiostoma macrostomum CBS 122681 TaxID=1314788 RepID=A0A6A6TLC7_9PLEO|nr:DUF382-domain-containing protein [Lophiostoma macrostomum CBS 122681]